LMMTATTPVVPGTFLQQTSAHVSDYIHTYIHT
jgi:hypothetical protein